MTDKATAIIEDAIAALRAEADVIEGKISALEGALGEERGSVVRPLGRRPSVTNGRRSHRTPAPSPKRIQTVTPIRESVGKDEKLQEAANKRAASWTPEKKKAAAERMRKYWADRKKN